ncbi:MAG: hypothetical protein ACOYD0_08190 [Candidatus Nanopelagicales bacterium]
MVGAVLIGIDWRVPFYVVPGIWLLMLFVVPFTLPETTKRGAGQFDGLGLGCLGVGMVSLLLGLRLAATSVTSVKTWAAVVLGLVILGLFAVIEKKSSKAAFPIELFKSLDLRGHWHGAGRGGSGTRICCRSAAEVPLGRGLVVVLLLARRLKRRPNRFAQEAPELVEL